MFLCFLFSIFIGILFVSLGRVILTKCTFCKCEDESEVTALLRYGLWGCTAREPTTAFTLELMELCHSIQMEGQISLQKFCHSLESQVSFIGDPIKTKPDLYGCLSCGALAEYRLHHQYMLTRVSSPETLTDRCPICTKVLIGCN